MNKQPWLAGIFGGSLLLVGSGWLLVVLPGKASFQANYKT